MYAIHEDTSGPRSDLYKELLVHALSRYLLRHATDRSRLNKRTRLQGLVSDCNGTARRKSIPRGSKLSRVQSEAAARQFQGSGFAVSGTHSVAKSAPAEKLVSKRR